MNIPLKNIRYDKLHYITLWANNHQLITEKDKKPVDADGSQTYTDEKLSEIIDQSLQIMDTDLDGYVSFPEFVKTQQDMKNTADAS